MLRKATQIEEFQYKVNKRMQYERDEFNNHQNFLYKRALFGLTVYTPEELDKMHRDKKKRITKVSKHAQYVLNLWKQEIVIGMTNLFFLNMFPDSPLTRELVTNYTLCKDPDMVNTINFRDLGVRKKNIVDKLIMEGVLPRDFYQLKPLEHGKDNNKKAPGTEEKKFLRTKEFVQGDDQQGNIMAKSPNEEYSQEV